MSFIPSPLGEKVFGINTLELLHETITFRVSVDEQPALLETFKVILAFVVAVSTGLGQVVQLRPFVGLHR